MPFYQYFCIYGVLFSIFLCTFEVTLQVTLQVTLLLKKPFLSFPKIVLVNQKKTSINEAKCCLNMV